MTDHVDSVTRPFYTIDDTPDEVLKWLEHVRLWHTMDGDECQRIEKQTTYLALYLNYSPASQRIFTATDTSINVFESKKDYYPVLDSILTDGVNQWTSRLTARKPEFSLLPRQATDPTAKERAKIAKAVLTSKMHSENAAELDELNVRNQFIMGESFLEETWSDREGPLDIDIQKDIDKRGQEALDEYGESYKHLRLGDTKTEIHDPRNVVVQPAKSYSHAEWVMLICSESTEKLKFQNPDKAELIQETENTKVFEHNQLSTYFGVGRTVVMKFYHRACPEVPRGRVITATPEVILSDEGLSSDKWIKNQRFPVVAFYDLEVLGSSRGRASTIMDSAAYAQIALNNLWIQAVLNIAMHSPKLLLQKGSVNLSDFRVSDRNIITYGKSLAKPELMVQETVSQGHLLMIDKLRDRILKNINIMPITRGDSIPNLESKQMFDAFKSQETAQSIPKDSKHARILKEWATLKLELMADKYEADETRSVQYFGKLKRSQVVDFFGKDLNVDVDVYVDTISAFSGTLEGKIATIQSILSLAPNLYTPAEVIEKLELASPEKVYDEITASIEAARSEVDRILSGKEVRAPVRYMNLLTYYDVYRQELNKKEVREILPDVFDPSKDDAGNKLLLQLAAIEELIFSMLGDVGITDPMSGAQILKGDMPVSMPQINLPPGATLKSYIYGKYPEFPSVYKADIKMVPNPMEIADQAIPPDQSAIDPSILTSVNPEMATEQ